MLIKMTMHFFTQVLLISQFELKRAFATRKGVLYLATFAVVWAVILRYPLRFAAELMLQQHSFSKGFSLFDWFGREGLQQWSIPEFEVFWHFALLAFPLLSISLAADQSCSDRERGTLRFIVLRSSRERVFFGRFVGVLFVQTVLICATGLSTLALVLSRDAALFSVAFTSLLALTLAVILAVLPFTAMMTALSARVKSARQATVWAILIWTLLSGMLSGLAYALPTLAFLHVLIPGTQLDELAQLAEGHTLRLAYIPLGQTLFLLALGRWLMARQAL